jgi:hypothetical protein
MPAGALVQTSTSCKALNCLANNEQLWQNLCLDLWPNTSALKLHSFKKFYKNRKCVEELEARRVFNGPAICEYAPITTLEDYDLLVDITAGVGPTKVRVSQALKLAPSIATGNFNIPWAAVQPLIASTAPALESPTSSFTLSSFVVRKSDSKTALHTYIHAGLPQHMLHVDSERGPPVEYTLQYESLTFSVREQWYGLGKNGRGYYTDGTDLGGCWRVCIEEPEDLTDPQALVSASAYLELEMETENGTDFPGIDDKMLLMYLEDRAVWT